MPTENKTVNLNLNSWIGTDKPKREDFVNDNIILDTIISNHMLDTSLHFTASDREKLEERPFVLEILTGDGNASKKHILSITPKMVIVFTTNQPLVGYDKTNNCAVCNSGIAYADNTNLTLNINNVKQ